MSIASTSIADSSNDTTNEVETVGSTIEKSVDMTGKGVIAAMDSTVSTVNKVFGIVLGVVSIVHGVVGIVYRSVGVTYAVVDNVGQFVESQGAKYVQNQNAITTKEPMRPEAIQWEPKIDRRRSL